MLSKFIIALNKSFILFILSIFLCSAFEVEIGETHQTFFDEYDTYVPAKPISVKKAEANNTKTKKNIFKKQEAKYCACSPVSAYHIELKKSGLLNIIYQSPHLPYTILLQKSELRI